MPVLPPAPLLVPELPMSALASRAEAGVAAAGRGLLLLLCSGILFPPDSFMLPSKYSRQTDGGNSGADRAKLVLSCRN
jgi:hypothetical protein